jgi:hypothetical protein
VDHVDLVSLPAESKNELAPSKKRRLSAADRSEAIQAVSSLIVELEWAGMAVSEIAPALEAKMADFADDLQNELYDLEDLETAAAV